MKRCQKKDKSSGMGCIKAAGHFGRCTIRPDAADVWIANGGQGPAATAAESPRSQKAAGSGRLVAQDLVGAVNDFAQLVGLPHVRLPGEQGLLYFGPTGRQVVVRPDGVLSEIEIRVKGGAVLGAAEA